MILLLHIRCNQQIYHIYTTVCFPSSLWEMIVATYVVLAVSFEFKNVYVQKYYFYLAILNVCRTPLQQFLIYLWYINVRCYHVGILALLVITITILEKLIFYETCIEATMTWDPLHNIKKTQHLIAFIIKYRYFLTFSNKREPSLT